MSQNSPLYIPIFCERCTEHYLVLRVRFGAQVEKSDFFIPYKYSGFWYRFVRRILTKSGEIACPKCRQALQLTTIIKRAAMGLVEEQKNTFYKTLQGL